MKDESPKSFAPNPPSKPNPPLINVPVVNKTYEAQTTFSKEKNAIPESKKEYFFFYKLNRLVDEINGEYINNFYIFNTPLEALALRLSVIRDDGGSDKFKPFTALSAQEISQVEENSKAFNKSRQEILSAIRKQYKKTAEYFTFYKKGKIDVKKIDEFRKKDIPKLFDDDFPKLRQLITNFFYKYSINPALHDQATSPSFRGDKGYYMSLKNLWLGCASDMITAIDYHSDILIKLKENQSLQNF